MLLVLALLKKVKSENVNAFTFVPYHGTLLRQISEKKNYIKKNVLCNMVETEKGIAPSQLNMPSISKHQIMGLVKTFSLYARMPRSYWKEIKIAEQLDDKGHKKYLELMNIYQKNFASLYTVK